MKLPLFPLRTVLFPGGVLPLKVFEQRYIDMTKDCLANERPFGVVLITQGSEVAQPGEAKVAFESIGTTARITNWDMPQLGILHVATLGGPRFKVERHVIEGSGLVVGDVRELPAEPRVPLATSHSPLANLLELIAARVGPENFPADADYGDASWVGYRLAELLPLPLPIKQSMLEINDAGVRLTVLQKFLSEQGVL
ncbi:MAG TPA: LON peptidase substrate-binding domain-containing protein [Casimicrobiaceae bacterium]|nr:LON peptidase substrate-binding domain-containing protein [Casimicrobiaceae bacterium]